MKREFIVTSPPEKESLVVEIWCDDALWAEVFQEGNETRVALYPHPHHKAWDLPFAEATDLLNCAHRKLLGE